MINLFRVQELLIEATSCLFCQNSVVSGTNAKVLCFSNMVKSQQSLWKRGEVNVLRRMVMRTNRAIYESKMEHLISNLLLLPRYLPKPKSAPSCTNF